MSDDLDDDYVAPKTPFDYISINQLQDLWGAGYTVIRRNAFGNDVYELADRVKRPGMARQWVAREELDDNLWPAWTRVACEDYPGLFAPFGYVGPVEIGRLVLVECPQHRVGKAKQAQVAAAEKLVTDWQDKYGGEFSGSVTIAGQTGKLDSVKTMQVGETKTIENVTAIPRDMAPYIGQIFEERDKLASAHVDAMKTKTGTNFCQEWADWMENHPGDPQWPTLHKILLPTAIENVRKRIAEEAASAKAS